MTTIEAIETRHSIRKYKTYPISSEHKQELEALISRINAEQGLHFQLFTNRPEAFKSLLASYGGFKNAVNYIALVGKDTPDLDEACGYFGEQIVLKAQQLGLSTCWVGGSFNKKKAFYEAAAGEKLCLIISIGYPDEPGRVHKSKSPQQVMNTAGYAPDSIPDWFMEGVRLALLAPTAINQQKFTFSLDVDGNVTVKAGIGPFSKVDLGIVKYHFEVGAGKADLWKKI